MNKERAAAKLREICAEIQSDRAEIQGDISRLFLKNWQPEIMEKALRKMMVSQTEMLLTETYNGESFNPDMADRAITAILMGAGLLLALQADKKGKRDEAFL